MRYEKQWTWETDIGLFASLALVICVMLLLFSYIIKHPEPIRNNTYNKPNRSYNQASIPKKAPESLVVYDNHGTINITYNK